MKKFFKIFIFTLTICLSLSMLIACGTTGGNNSNKKKSGDNSQNGGNVTEDKVSVNQAMTNYEELDAKRSDTEINLALDIYTPRIIQQDTKTERISVDINATRIENDGKIYNDYTFEPGEDISGMVKSLVATIFKICKGEDAIAERIQKNMSDEQKLQLRKFAPYVEYLDAFLQGKIELGAEIGYNGDDINIIADYKYARSSNDISRDSFWIGASRTGLGRFAGCEISNDFIEKLLYEPAFYLAVKAGGTDSASIKVDDKGVATYVLTPTAKKASDALVEVAKDFLTVFGFEMNSELVSKFSAKIDKWVTVDSSTVNRITVGSDKRPSSLDMTYKISANIATRELQEFIVSLGEYGLSENVRGIINNIIGYASTLVCGLNGESDMMGFEFEAKIHESYKYGTSDCNIDNKKEELYLDMEEDVENRIEVDAIVNTLGMDEINACLDFIATQLGQIEEIKEESALLVERIREKINEMAEVNLIAVKDAVETVLYEYSLETETELDVRIADIVKIVLKSRFGWNTDSQEESEGD